jgi:uncharacterized small protein (DUF1192 family)
MPCMVVRPVVRRTCAGALRRSLPSTTESARLRARGAGVSRASGAGGLATSNAVSGPQVRCVMLTRAARRVRDRRAGLHRSVASESSAADAARSEWDLVSSAQRMFSKSDRDRQGCVCSGAAAAGRSPCTVSQRAGLFVGKTGTRYTFFWPALPLEVRPGACLARAVRTHHLTPNPVACSLAWWADKDSRRRQVRESAGLRRDEAPDPWVRVHAGSSCVAETGCCACRPGGALCRRARGACSGADACSQLTPEQLEERVAALQDELYKRVAALEQEQQQRRKEASPAQPKAASK